MQRHSSLLILLVLLLFTTSSTAQPYILQHLSIERFISRFGKEEIAVLHSKLSIGERHDEWKRIKENKARNIQTSRRRI